MDRFPIT